MTTRAQQIIEQADSCLKAGRYEELIPLYEQLEFQVSAIEIDAVPLNTIYEPLLASYLVANDLHSARGLVDRIPEEYKTQAPQLATLIQVLDMMRQWERQNGKLKDIYNLLHQSRWDTSLAPLMALLQDSIQERELNILAKAYTSLPVQLAASRVWVEEDAAAEQLVATLGWRYDASAGLLYPKAQEPIPNRAIGLQEFGQLADVVAHLEVKQESS
ncbi:COP9 signalosome complex subunit 8 [Entomortierella chlamydospora]|uniref:COP9 signalosome complex subunit 8 n=1 Tax=Entomortierella chlamydospora TaxID=101097 RepID=A0A9P6T251_9FUNG|nr:COP9 signalosome complex subunit 8 [Entomortierella chlamydospora]KAG0019369.1 COP9 signalosome complex subunit 8 [Entomortierella chlamydospora]